MYCETKIVLVLVVLAFLLVLFVLLILTMLTILVVLGVIVVLVPRLYWEGGIEDLVGTPPMCHVGVAVGRLLLYRS